MTKRELTKGEKFFAYLIVIFLFPIKLIKRLIGNTQRG